MWGILCNIISYGQVHKIKPGPRATNIVLFEKKSQLKRRKAGQAYKNRIGQANKTGKRRASLTKEGIVRFTRARTHVRISIQFKGTADMIHDIPELRIFPIRRIWVRIIVTCTEDVGNIQGMRGVRKQLQDEEQNIRQPSRMALNGNTAVQQS